MKSTLNRRKFLTRCTAAALGCCGLLFGSNKIALAITTTPANNNEIPDPKKLNYCGYICPKDCKFLKATQENNIELKKEAYKEWKIKEKYGIEFDADKIFCWGCKVKDKPTGVALNNCTVRKCTLSKGFDSCIECGELTACKKELWNQFPEFKKKVVEMQKKYVESKQKKQ